MRLTICVILTFTLSSCAAVAVNKEPESANKPFRTEVAATYEQTWNKVISYFYTEGFAFKANNKEQGVLAFELKDALISFKDKEDKIKDSAALAITEIRKKINNNVYVYPVKGILEWQILVQKKDDNTTYVYFSLKSKGTITRYTYNSVQVNKVVKNADFRTTGRFENKLIDELAKK